MHFKLGNSGLSEVRLAVVLAYIFVVDGALGNVTHAVGDSVLTVSVLDLNGNRFVLGYAGSSVVFILASRRVNNHVTGLLAGKRLAFMDRVVLNGGLNRRSAFTEVVASLLKIGVKELVVNCVKCNQQNNANKDDSDNEG
jgi:hypothetical protein